MNLHKEICFEDEICQCLKAQGWLYSANDDGYDRNLALFPDDVSAWVKATQPDAWDALTKNHGAAAGDTPPTCGTKSCSEKAGSKYLGAILWPSATIKSN